MAGKQPDKFHWGMQALSGSCISKEEAEQLEERLRSDAFDYSARATLLGYYSSGRTKSKVAARNRIKHILWAVEHAPECDLGKTPYLHISKSADAQAYQKEKEILLRQCERFKADAGVLSDCSLGCSVTTTRTSLYSFSDKHTQ